MTKRAERIAEYDRMSADMLATTLNYGRTTKAQRVAIARCLRLLDRALDRACDPARWSGRDCSTSTTREEVEAEAACRLEAEAKGGE